MEPPRDTVVTPGALTATSSYCSSPRIPVEPQGDTVVTLVCSVVHQEIL